MSQYKIISDNTTLGKKGATINASDLEGFNVDALIEGKHIEVAFNTLKNVVKKEQE